MTGVDVERRRPLVRFDHHSPEFAADPWSQLRELRESAPVAFSDAHGGFWVLTRYEDIRRVALDDATFSSADSIVIPPKKHAGQRSIPIETDPPIFYEYRRAMAPMFAPHSIERLDPIIEAFVDRSIDEFIERGEADLVHDLAHPVPAVTTLHKLGLPTDDWRRFAEPLHNTVYLRQDNPERPAALAGLRVIREELVAAVTARRAHPRDDMLTYLIGCEVEGRPLNDTEVVDMASLTLQGGLDTTASAIGSALVFLDRDRDARQRLIDHPELLPSAVEEFLRYEAPQLALARTATRDVEIGGQVIRSGERVLMVWASGNRDPAAFEDADQVLLDRSPNRHMTFGLGAHRCLGSTLARRELLFTLRAVLHRLADYELDPALIVRAETVGVSYGYLSLPAHFTPGARFRQPT